ncbi:ADP-ribosylglycohydrolase [Hokovirus HKV1]|mgnify:CR=1 FL=1|uniref:ADP-ribosylglycohydrolase n=1 Tax=Hokovirus HKV1 TaxID=1977638 RepID=A0A1V0SFY3_9VIRU|nr:ADP-ribosylglycohydrolase [Hokovirus HKV1]
MVEKFINCMLCHALGDTIGYKNGEWEFMGTLDKVYEFIDLGGVNNISLENWLVSDDTVLHMKLAESLLTDYKSINTLCENFSNNLIIARDDFLEEGLAKRAPGNITMAMIKNLKDGIKWNEQIYNTSYGGSGASMRTACIGLLYHGLNNRSLLMQVAIETSRITHNSAVGFLGGYTTALFSAFAIEGLPIEKWPFLLLEYRDSILEYIKLTKRDVKQYENDSHIFYDKWITYIKDKFDDNKQVIKRKSTINLYFRCKYYRDKLSYLIKSNNYDRHMQLIGAGGDDSVIIAYDCLLDAKENWEKLIFYAMLHTGDTDTTGCIAGAWYGILYGIESIPKNNFKNLEYKEKIINLATNLYNKYKNNN